MLVCFSIPCLFAPDTCWASEPCQSLIVLCLQTSALRWRTRASARATSPGSTSTRSASSTSLTFSWCCCWEMMIECFYKINVFGFPPERRAVLAVFVRGLRRKHEQLPIGGVVHLHLWGTHWRTHTCYSAPWWVLTALDQTGHLLVDIALGRLRVWGRLKYFKCQIFQIFDKSLIPGGLKPRKAICSLSINRGGCQAKHHCHYASLFVALVFYFTLDFTLVSQWVSESVGRVSDLRHLILYTWDMSWCHHVIFSTCDFVILSSCQLIILSTCPLVIC